MYHLLQRVRVIAVDPIIAQHGRGQIPRARQLRFRLVSGLAGTEITPDPPTCDAHHRPGDIVLASTLPAVLGGGTSRFLFSLQWAPSPYFRIRVIAHSEMWMNDSAQI